MGLSMPCGSHLLGWSACLEEPYLMNGRKRIAWPFHHGTVPCLCFMCGSQGQRNRLDQSEGPVFCCVPAPGKPGWKLFTWTMRFDCGSFISLCLSLSSIYRFTEFTVLGLVHNTYAFNSVIIYPKFLELRNSRIACLLGKVNAFWWKAWILIKFGLLERQSNKGAG